jgi:hypothetical protein
MLFQDTLLRLLRQREELPAQFAEQAVKCNVDRTFFVPVFVPLGNQFVQALHQGGISQAALVLGFKTPLWSISMRGTEMAMSLRVKEIATAKGWTQTKLQRAADVHLSIIQGICNDP